MLTNISFGQYMPGDSAVHRLDPRTKIILTIVFIILLFSARGWAGYALVGLLTLLTIRIAGSDFGRILRSIRPLLLILFLTVTLQALLNEEGEILLQLGWFKIYSGGLEFGLMMATRLIMLISFTSILTLTTSPIALTDGIEYLLQPFKRFGMPAHELAMMMTIALRFIPTLLDQAQMIMKAQQSRGADFESGNLWQRAKALMPILIPLFISAFRRADELAMAMEARCYRGGEHRTRLRELRFTKVDIYGVIYMAVFAAGIIYLRVKL